MELISLTRPTGRSAAERPESGDAEGFPSQQMKHGVNMHLFTLRLEDSCQFPIFSSPSARFHKCDKIGFFFPLNVIRREGW